MVFRERLCSGGCFLKDVAMVVDDGSSGNKGASLSGQALSLLSIFYTDIDTKLLTLPRAPLSLLRNLIPTPLLYYSLHNADLSGGVMITGSHNPPDHNGFKMCMKTESISGAALLEMKSIIESGCFSESERAGEMSGHIFFKDSYYGYDDAIYSAMRLIKILSESESSLSDLIGEYNVYKSTPEMRISVPDDKKFEYMDKFTKRIFDNKKTSGKIKDIITVDGVRIAFNGGWGLVRVSNTEPHFVLRFEADDDRTLSDIKNYVLGEVNKILKNRFAGTDN